MKVSLVKESGVWVFQLEEFLNSMKKKISLKTETKLTSVLFCFLKKHTYIISSRKQIQAPKTPPEGNIICSITITLGLTRTWFVPSVWYLSRRLQRKLRTFYTCQRSNHAWVKSLATSKLNWQRNWFGNTIPKTLSFPFCFKMG